MKDKIAKIEKAGDRREFKRRMEKITQKKTKFIRRFEFRGFLVTKSGLYTLDEIYSLAVDSGLVNPNDLITTSNNDLEKGLASILNFHLGSSSYELQRVTMETGEKKYRIRGDHIPGCFITSACTEVTGLPDNCGELQTLRKFRDEYVLELPQGPDLIRKYYGLAPRIVRTIQMKPNSHDIFSRIFEENISVATNNINEGNFEDALNQYKKMVDELKHKYLPQN